MAALNQLPPAGLTAPAGSCPAGTIKHTTAQVPAGFLDNVLSDVAECGRSVSSPFHAALNNREGQRDHGL